MNELPDKRASLSRSLARAFELAGWLVFSAILVSRVLVFGFDAHSPGNAFINFLIVGLVSVLFLAWMLGGGFELPPLKLLLPAGAFLLACTASILWTKAEVGTRRELVTWWGYGFLFVATLWMAKDLAGRRLAVSVIVASAVVLSAYGIYQRFGVLPGLEQEVLGHPGEYGKFMKDVASLLRISSRDVFATFVYSNAFAGYLVVVLPFVLMMAVRSFDVQRRVVVGVMLVACALVAVAFFLTKSRGALVAAAFALLVPVLFRRYPAAPGGTSPPEVAEPSLRSIAGRIVRCWPVFLPAAMVAASLLAVLLPAGRGSLGIRIGYWKTAFRMAADNLIGVGWGAFGANYTRYKTILATESRLAHNAFLEVLAEIGLFGLLAFTLTWTMAAFDILSRLRSRPQNSGGSKTGADEESFAAGQSNAVPECTAPVKENRERDRVTLAALGGLGAFVTCYALFEVMGSVELTTFVKEGIRAGVSYLAVSLHVLFPLVWLFVMLAALSVPLTARDMRLAALGSLSGFVVHSAGDFDIRIKGLMVTLLVLLGCAVAPDREPLSGETRIPGWRFAAPRGGAAVAAVVFFFAAAAGVLWWTAARPVYAWARLERAERAARRVNELSPVISKTLAFARLFHEGKVTESTVRELRGHLAEATFERTKDEVRALLEELDCFPAGVEAPSVGGGEARAPVERADLAPSPAEVTPETPSEPATANERIASLLLKLADKLSGIKRLLLDSSAGDFRAAAATLPEDDDLAYKSALACERLLGAGVRSTEDAARCNRLVESYLLRALRLAPTVYGYRESYGHYLLSRGRTVEAAAAYSSSVRLYPTNPYLLLHLGDALLRRSPQQAAESYRRGFLLDTQVADERTLLVSSFWSPALFKMKGPHVENETRDLLEKALRAANADTAPFFELRLAFLLAHTGRVTEAVERFRRCCDSRDGFQGALYLACASERVGGKETRSLWENVRGLALTRRDRLVVSLAERRIEWMHSAEKRNRTLQDRIAPEQPATPNPQSEIRIPKSAIE